jgi:pimeloyl-ACP methyl ester carboxylesterase
MLPFKRTFYRQHCVARRLTVAIVALTAVSLSINAGTAYAQKSIPRPRSATDTMSYVYTKGADTIAIERTVRRPEGVRGELLVRGSPRLVWEQHIDANNRAGAFDLEAYAASAAAGAEPAQSLTLRVANDSGFLDIHDKGATNTAQRLALAPNTMWMLNSSVLHMDILASLAVKRAQGGFNVVLAQGGKQIPVAVRVSGDTTTVTIEGNETQFIHDALGLKDALLGGGMTVHRATAAENALLSAKVQAEKPNYAAPAGAPYTATDVIVKTAGGNDLAGTLTRPKGVARPPVVIAISGSGEQERDARLPGIDGYAPFRDIADTLGRRGIAVLRFDDRGVGASTGRETRAVATTADYANDVRALVNFVRTRKDLDTSRIVLLGHSEGAMIAPMLASQDKGIRAVVLMAGPAYDGRRVLTYQYSNLPQVLRLPADQQKLFIARLPSMLDSLGKTSPWTGYFIEHDPLKVARLVTQPVLILQGATDHQITPEQADSLAATIEAGGNKNVTKVVFPNIDHLFLSDTSGIGTGYATLPSKKIAPPVLSTLADWLSAHLK